MNNNQFEKANLSTRFKSALTEKGIRHSPTVVAREFNKVHVDTKISVHSARNWLLGTVMPAQETLVALGKWLEVSPAELRFGFEVGKATFFKANKVDVTVNKPDRVMFISYLKLPQAKRIIIRDIVEAYCHATTSEES